jgi:16S rRNA (uracil1498-N3)-methyltransferase
VFSAGSAVLEGDELHHLRAVRRLGPGDEAELFDGAGRLARCRIARLDKRRAELDVLAVSEEPRPSRELVVATAIPKGDRMEWLVEKVTELGASAVWPLVARRSDVTGRGRSRRDKWHRRAIEAAKQCGRLWLPEIAEPAPLDEVVARAGSATFDAVLLADPSTEARRPADVLSGGPRRVAGFVGPEGGFTDEETAAICAAGARRVRLGEHILRIETAAVALAAAMAVT